MTTPELITDEIVFALSAEYQNQLRNNHSMHNFDAMKAALIAIQDDITRPYRNLLEGWKQNSEAYERALREIREVSTGGGCYDGIKDGFFEMQEITDAALKGDYHKTDFTEFCDKLNKEEV